MLFTGTAPALDFGRVGDLALGEATEIGLALTGLTSGLKIFLLEAALMGRRSEYGSAVAGRAISGRRGLAAGRIGAEDKVET